MSSEKWDKRFMEMAKLVASWSKDPSTKAGAVIVRPDKTIVSVGYNGFPSKMPDDPKMYENREEKYSRIVHAEVNALIYSREPVVGYTLYTYPFLSCDRCFSQLAQAGISTFVSPICPPHLLERWGKSFDMVRLRAKEMGINIQEYEDITP